MKKIIIFSSFGGGGHIAVTNALFACLKDQYELSQTWLFGNVLKSVDFFYIISGKQITGEQVWNFFTRHQLFRLLNIFYRFGRWYTHWRHKTICKLLKDYLEKEKPDLIISVIPIANHAILTVAQELNIPFILLPTDLDISSFVNNIPPVTYTQFYLTLSLDNKHIMQPAQYLRLPVKQLQITGIPLKPSFYEPKNSELIKKQYGIDLEIPVIVIIMGAQGSRGLYSFAQELSKLKQPAHLIICTGKYNGITKKIEEIAFPKHMSKTVLGFTHRVADLLAIADVFITKSGSISVYEGLYSRVPILIDNTKPGSLLWEQFNHHFIQDNNLGLVINNKKDIIKYVKLLIQNTPQRTKILTQLRHLNIPNGDEQVAHLIKELLS